MPAHRADARANAIYDRLTDTFGDGSARAMGYVSEWSFMRERALVLDAVGIEPGTIVDIGCGHGPMSAPLAQAGGQVIGLDYNARACSQAAHLGLKGVCGDAFDLPFADAAADLVLNVEMVQQYERGALPTLMNEAARVLRPGGRLVVVWGNRSALPHRLAYLAAPLLKRRGLTFDLVAHPPRHVREAAERAGLALDKWFAICPPLRWRLPSERGFLAYLFGTSFIAAFRKRPER